MSTIASPRPSIAASSRRTSTASIDTTSSRQPPASTTGSLRRNRTALRDYYNLKQAIPTDARDAPPTPPTLAASQESELDAPNFDAQTYVHSLLAREGLEGVLRVEAGLVSEIRSLDGEKKALVYDNYSKLIAATETIRRMRERMEPVADAKGLMGEIGRVAETAAELRGKAGRGESEGVGEEVGRRRQRETVRWVLDAPERLRGLMAAGRGDEAEREWREVDGLLERWKGVKGVKDVRRRCEEVMQSSQGG